MVVRIPGKTTTTLACIKTANIIIITLKTFNDMEENRKEIWASDTQNVALNNVVMCCVQMELRLFGRGLMLALHAITKL